MASIACRANFPPSLAWRSATLIPTISWGQPSALHYTLRCNPPHAIRIAHQVEDVTRAAVHAEDAGLRLGDRSGPQPHRAFIAVDLESIESGVTRRQLGSVRHDIAQGRCGRSQVGRCAVGDDESQLLPMLQLGERCRQYDLSLVNARQNLRVRAAGVESEECAERTGDVDGRDALLISRRPDRRPPEHEWHVLIIRQWLSVRRVRVAVAPDPIFLQLDEDIAGAIGAE